MGTQFFLMTAETACEVYDAFIMSEALSEKERVAILMKFVESGKVSTGATHASKEQLTEALMEHYKLFTVRRKDNA